MTQVLLSHIVLPLKISNCKLQEIGSIRNVQNDPLIPQDDLTRLLSQLEVKFDTHWFQYTLTLASNRPAVPVLCTSSEDSPLIIKTVLKQGKS